MSARDTGNNWAFPVQLDFSPGADDQGCAYAIESGSLYVAEGNCMDRNLKLNQRPWLRLGLSIAAFLFFISVSCNIPTKTPVPATPVVKLPTATNTNASQATVEIQKTFAAPVVNVPLDYYGPACDSGEEEGAPYRWSVELLQDPASGKLEGTIKFHACPGGGRAVYRVSGTTGNATTLILAGKKMGGGGELFGTAPEQETFNFDTSSGQLTPNLAP